jgi:hypothetical protein
VRLVLRLPAAQERQALKAEPEEQALLELRMLAR